MRTFERDLYKSPVRKLLGYQRTCGFRPEILRVEIRKEETIERPTCQEPDQKKIQRRTQIL